MEDLGRGRSDGTACQLAACASNILGRSPLLDWCRKCDDVNQTFKVVTDPDNLYSRANVINLHISAAIGRTIG